ncbi:ABC transporter related protein [Thioalkalivibrio nitratireducens DSM 14787]|uniref:ABC transporter related protein n=1 Tax=Thioalkalivibrio nitratireducens (strain DSM 14787 / UNIQEM 213 / ALEN2) TaxID=1255043 RepID=L0DVI9_THIND|nr:ABC transporter ATP-binding protein [Thioalkalivibrio nitratireducens]AGA33027.1 ABC transporter related protein [Thioalkalivibrio nitratireducens DSM 14787]
MSAALLQLNALVIDVPGRTGAMALDAALLPGQCWGLLGPNGAGKTTLLHTLAGLRRPRSGQILIDGQPLPALPPRRVARRLGLVFQDHHDGFPSTVLETALIGRHPFLRAWDLEGADDHEIAHRALARMDLEGLATRQVQTLSGGERQRLAIATLLTQDPPLWLLDEPTNHLDLRHQVQVLELIRGEVANHGRGAVLALHDPNLAASYCTHLILMYPDGGLCWGRTADVFHVPALERLFGQTLEAIETGDRLWVRPVAAPRAGAR